MTLRKSGHIVSLLQAHWEVQLPEFKLWHWVPCSPVLHTAHSNIARQDTALQSCPLPCGKIRKPSSDFLAEQRALHHYDHITVHLFISRFPLAKGPLSLRFYTNVIVSFGIKHDDKNDRVTGHNWHLMYFPVIGFQPSIQQAMQLLT